MSENIIIYIDGLNLFHGLIGAKFKKYLWLDINKLSEIIKGQNSKPHTIKYFFSWFIGNSLNYRNQQKYIKAIKTLNNVKLFKGRHRRKNYKCKKPDCGYMNRIPIEKMTDINIAVQMLHDSINGECEKQILISGDNDCIPIIEYIQNNCITGLHVWFPPARKSSELIKFCRNYSAIKEKHLIVSQFDNHIRITPHYSIKKPAEWN